MTICSLAGENHTRGEKKSMDEPTKEEIEAFKKEFKFEDEFHQGDFYQKELAKLRDVAIQIDIDQELMDDMDETEEERENANKIGRGTYHLNVGELECTK